MAQRYIYFIGPLFGLILFTLLAQYTSITFLVADLFYMPDNEKWIGADSWLANTLMHDWGRNLIAFIFLIALILFICSFFNLSFTKKFNLRKWRKNAAYIALCIALTTSLVGLGKKYTNIDCPRDLKQYGGKIPYTHLFSHKSSTFPHSRCFPGGHSSGAFSLFALYFLFLLYRPKYARRIFLFVLLLGFTYSLTQWARGAHFFVDDLWSAVIAWYISLSLAILMFRKEGRLFNDNIGMTASMSTVPKIAPERYSMIEISASPNKQSLKNR